MLASFKTRINAEYRRHEKSASYHRPFYHLQVPGRKIVILLNKIVFAISISDTGIEQFANPFPLAIGQGLLEGAEQLIQVQIAVAQCALEGIEFTLQGVETGALGAVGQLAAGRVYGLGQGLAIVLLTQGLQQLAHEVVDGGAVRLAVGVLNSQPLEQALHRGCQAIFLHGGLGLGLWRAVAEQLAAELEGKGGEGKQGADGDHDVTLRYG